MANSKIPVATTIPLSPLAGEEFYAVIIQEESKKTLMNNVWLFRKGREVAHKYISAVARKDDPAMTIDGIKALDATGRFDEFKEMLAELDE